MVRCIAYLAITIALSLIAHFWRVVLFPDGKGYQYQIWIANGILMTYMTLNISVIIIGIIDMSKNLF